MAKRIKTVVKLQIPAGKATPAPPIGTALGPHGINLMMFCKEYNARTADQAGMVIPAEITIFEDRSFTFIQGEKVFEAEGAGADFVGLDDLIKQIEGDWLGFDVAIATPDVMGKVVRLGKKLGPRGLMPSPKAGTITFDLAKTIRDVKAGRVEFKVDRTALLHIPAGAKGTYIKSITLTSTMSPSIHLDVSAATALKPLS